MLRFIMNLKESVKRKIEEQTGEPVPNPATSEWEAYFEKHPKYQRLADTSMEFPLSDPIEEERKKQKAKSTKEGLLARAFKRVREQDGKVVWGKGKALGIVSLLLLAGLGYVLITEFSPKRPSPITEEVEEVEEEPVEVEIEPNPVDDALSAFDALDFDQRDQGNQGDQSASDPFSGERQVSETQSTTQAVQIQEPDPFAFAEPAQSTQAAPSGTLTSSGEPVIEPPPPANGLNFLTPKGPRQGVVSAGSARAESGLTAQNAVRTNGLAQHRVSSPQAINLAAVGTTQGVASSRADTASTPDGREIIKTTEPANFSGFEDAEPAVQGSNVESVDQVPADFASTSAGVYQPGDTLLGTLEVGVVMVDQDDKADSAESRVVVRGLDDSVWLGNVTLQRSGRVSIEFYSVVHDDGAQPIQAIALGPDSFAGVDARFRETTPALASDLARGALRGVSEYVDGLNDRSSTTFRGFTPVITNESAGLGESVGGSVSRLFTPPQGEAQQAIVRVAEVDPGTEMTIIVIE